MTEGTAIQTLGNPTFSLELLVVKTQHRENSYFSECSSALPEPHLYNNFLAWKHELWLKMTCARFRLESQRPWNVLFSCVSCQLRLVTFLHDTTTSVFCEPLPPSAYLESLCCSHDSFLVFLILLCLLKALFWVFWALRASVYVNGKGRLFLSSQGLFFCV